MKYILILGMIVSFNAQAWEMDRVGFSKGTNFGTERRDGNWKQDGPSVFYHRNDKSNTQAFEIGGKTNLKWLRWSLEYVDRGNQGVWGRFVTDENYVARRFKGEIHESWLLQTSTRAFVFTLDPSWRYKKVTLYAQLGVSRYHSKTKYCFDRPIVNLTSCPKGWMGKSTERGFTFYHAQGIEWHVSNKQSLFLMRYETKREYDTISPNRNNKGYRIGYRFYFK